MLSGLQMGLPFGMKVQRMLSNGNPINFGPSVAIAEQYGWKNALGNTAQYLESVDTLINAGSGSDGVQTTESSRPICLAHDGTNYLHLSGVGGNYASTPDSSELDIIGDIKIVGNLTPDSWTAPSDYYVVAAKRGGGSSSFQLALSPSGHLLLNWWDAGDVLQGEQSTVVTPFTGAVSRWVRCDLDVDTGSGYSIKFYTSEDGTAWTQLGATKTGATPTSILSSTAPLNMGFDGGGAHMRGAIHRVQIFSSLDDSDKRFDVDFSTFAHGATSGVASTGQIVTINQNGGNMATIVGHPMLRFDGSDDSFFVATPNIEGPVTLVYVMRQNEDQSVLIYKAMASAGFTGANDPISLNTAVDSTPDGIASYRKNGASIAVTDRTFLSNELSFQRVLLTATYTYNSTGFSGFNFGNFGGADSWLGDLEALFVFNRILSPTELADLEAYLLAYYGI